MRKKPPPPALFAVKGDFYDSLDAYCQAGLVLHQALLTALDLDQVSAAVAPLLREKLAAFERAMSPSFSDGDSLV